MVKSYLTICFILLATICYGQKFSVNDAACDPTTTKTALKYFKQSQNAKDNDEKRELLNKAIGADPNYYEAHFQLGIQYYKKKKFAMAKSCLEQVADICPKYSPYTYYILGQIYYDEKNWKVALDNCKKFMEFEDIDDNEKYLQIQDLLPTLEAYAELFTKPVPFNPHPVNGVCTPEDEYLGSLSPDNKHFYYIRKVLIQPTDMNKGYGNAPYFRELFTVSANSQTGFDGGTFMDRPFNDRFDNGDAAITADNKHMYFVVCQDNFRGNCDLWFTEMKNGKWSPLMNMGYTINSNVWDSQPTISYDGKTMIFSSMRPGGFGGSDLWITHKNEKGVWTPPVNMGDTINTDKNELT